MLKLYEVRSPGGHSRHIEAKSSTQAKRIYCRQTGRRASDRWTGISALTARLVKGSLWDEIRKYFGENEIELSGNMPKVTDASNYRKQYPRDDFWALKDVNECRMWSALSGLAQKNNIKVKVVDFKEVLGAEENTINGLILSIKGKTHIFIDDRVPNAFKFKILAHELAHFQLHNSKPSYCFNTAEYLKDKFYRRAVEMEADAFAERLIRFVRYKLNSRGMLSGNTLLKAVV